MSRLNAIPVPSSPWSRGLWRAGLCLLALAVLSSPSLAQRYGQRFEIAGFAGVRVGGNVSDKGQDRALKIDDGGSFGFLVDFDLDGEAKLELMFSRQPTTLFDKDDDSNPILDMDVDFFQFGGLYQWNQRPLWPFINATAGFARWAPTSVDIDPEYFLAFSLGAGLKTYFKKPKWLGLRFDARTYMTLLNSGDELFCDVGECITVKGGILFEFEGTVGLLFAF